MNYGKNWLPFHAIFYLIFLKFQKNTDDAFYPKIFFIPTLQASAHSGSNEIMRALESLFQKLSSLKKKKDFAVFRYSITKNRQDFHFRDWQEDDRADG